MISSITTPLFSRRSCSLFAAQSPLATNKMQTPIDNLRIIAGLHKQICSCTLSVLAEIPTLRFRQSLRTIVKSERLNPTRLGRTEWTDLQDRSCCPTPNHLGRLEEGYLCYC